MLDSDPVYIVYAFGNKLFLSGYRKIGKARHSLKHPCMSWFTWTENAKHAYYDRTHYVIGTQPAFIT